MPKIDHRGWREFLRGKPGRRFQDAHIRHMERGQHAQGLQRWLLVGLEALLMLAGLVMLVLPGPGLLVALAGLGLLAREFLGLARVLDRGELALHSAFLRVRHWWRQRAPRG
ncbi:PGPGW domain-containing protein [Brevifollis gellanilyticus]|nr:PGPGW domain-containing protein [Brevifollis gellanilyticus]